jgi:hypothetical protein
MTTGKTNLEYRAVRNDSFTRNDLPHVYFHNRIAPADEAKFAMAILERWAMVQGQPDGEDSAGRAKISLTPVEDAVRRACDLSQRAFEVFRERNWLVDIPSLDELEAEIKDREDRAENK